MSLFELLEPILYSISCVIDVISNFYNRKRKQQVITNLPKVNFEEKDITYATRV